VIIVGADPEDFSGGRVDAEKVGGFGEEVYFVVDKNRPAKAVGAGEGGFPFDALGVELCPPRVVGGAEGGADVPESGLWRLCGLDDAAEEDAIPAFLQGDFGRAVAHVFAAALGFAVDPDAGGVGVVDAQKEVGLVG